MRPARVKRPRTEWKPGMSSISVGGGQPEAPRIIRSTDPRPFVPPPHSSPAVNSRSSLTRDGHFRPGATTVYRGSSSSTGQAEKRSAEKMKSPVTGSPYPPPPRSLADYMNYVMSCQPWPPPTSPDPPPTSIAPPYPPSYRAHIPTLLPLFPTSPAPRPPPPPPRPPRPRPPRPTLPLFPTSPPSSIDAAVSCIVGRLIERTVGLMMEGKLCPPPPPRNQGEMRPFTFVLLEERPSPSSTAVFFESPILLRGSTRSTNLQGSSGGDASTRSGQPQDGRLPPPAGADGRGTSASEGPEGENTGLDLDLKL